jgi:hypothetical protein
MFALQFQFLKKFQNQRTSISNTLKRMDDFSMKEMLKNQHFHRFMLFDWFLEILRTMAINSKEPS